MTEIKTLSLTDRSEWRKWLESNHRKEKDIWLIHYKKHTGKSGISYNDAVEEAICFGWIDGKMRRVDDEKFILRYSPRKKNSIWSEINKKRAEEMIKEGKMTREGFAKVEEAKRSGTWSSAYTSKKKPKLPPELKKALLGDKKAWDNFNNFANSYQLQYIFWVNNAKSEETRKSRIKEVVERAKQNKKTWSEKIWR